MGEGGQPGASLRAWREFFPNADIFGADIDRHILFQEERIHTYWVDQTSPAAIESMWAEIKEGDFDLMIDDGLHQVAAGLCLLEGSLERLGETGAYIIEDVTPRQMVDYAKYFGRRRDLWVEFMIREDANHETGGFKGLLPEGDRRSSRDVSPDNGLIIVRKANWANVYSSTSKVSS